MQKFKRKIFFVISLFAIVFNVKGATTCGYEEKAKLNNEVANLKANYEIKTRVLDESEYDIPDALLGTEAEKTYVATTEYIQVNFLNLTENMYVEVSNDYNKDVKIINYSDTNNGTITFDWSEIYDLVTFTFQVYASDNTGCKGSKLKKITLALPRYNDYSTYGMCNNLPDFYLCQKYVTYEEVGFDVFVSTMFKEVDKKIEKENKEKEENSKWYNQIKNFIVEHKTPFIIGGIVLVVGGSATAFIIIKRRRRSII